MKNKEMMPIFIGVVAVLLVVLGVVIGVSVAKQGGGSTEPSYNVNLPTEDSEEELFANHPMYDRKIETFLILGVDNDSKGGEYGEGARSDSVITIVVDHKNKTIKVASLLRDCYVKIEGHNFNKLNMANYYGGPKLALSTVKDNFDIDIKEYIQVNFESLVELVDNIGGVEIEIAQVECKKPGLERFSKPGKYLLNGDEALAYSRLRKLAGEDRARSERQRNVLFALFEKTKTMSTDESVELVDEMIDKIDTSYHEDEIVEILYYMSRYKITGMEAFPLVYYDGLVGETWHEVPTTLIDMNTDLHAFLYDYKEYVPSEGVKSLSDAMKEVASEPNMNYKEQSN